MFISPRSVVCTRILSDIELHQRAPPAMEARRDTDQSPHIAVLASAGAGHLIPLAELARRLVVRHGFSVTFIATADSNSPFYKSFAASLLPGLAAVTLPPVEISAGPVDPVVAIAQTIRQSLPAIRCVLADLQRTSAGRLVAFVADLFGTDTFDVARELGVPPFLFFPSNLFLLSLSLHLPGLHVATTSLPDPLALPGCPPISFNDLPDVTKDRASDGYAPLLHILNRYGEAEGILVNTFREIEPGAMEALTGDKSAGRPPVHLVGPLVETMRQSSDESLCLEWLEKQPDASVLYVCFGSLGVLSEDQTAEMALGLERSGHRFLWAIHGSLSYLPEGFLERTRDTGLVVTSWAPQAQILGHRSVGGFVTHCGWSSALEGVVQGVPMVAWPLYAEQRMNALLLVEGLGVALRAEGEGGESGLVGRKAIAAVVAELMVGEGGRVARERLRPLREAGVKAMAEGGDGHKTLDEVFAKWTDTI